MSISVGDRVRDTNPNWPNYDCTGVVTSVNGNMITWIHDTSNELITDNVNDLEKTTSRRNKMPYGKGTYGSKVGRPSKKVKAKRKPKAKKVAKKKYIRKLY